eukprot:NODE_808_length_1325_cov_265.923197_g613_i0.p1 GENE.NODE_808_length_1325_cov_265.923197_g613_i0~~NODE_808_length_1325_cov_265.923197_g613_i0.p1  ORF type:complete len:329 (+),score=86.33 NODE_808_length_1325_cov_265.923197_g613_i0:80-988(+)
MPEKGVVGCGICSLATGVLLVLILVPISFQYVDRNQMAFKKNTVSNKIDTETVFPPGRYFWGVGHSVVSFPSTYQHVENSLIVFTTTGMEIVISFTFQYKLKRDQLHRLFYAYGMEYDKQILNVARTAVRNAAIQYSLFEYITDRERIMNSLHAELAAALDAIYVSVPPSKFQLRRVTLPPSIQAQFLDTFVQNERNREKREERQAVLTRKSTQRDQERILNRTKVLQATMQSLATRTLMDARARADRMREVARSHELARLFTAINITGDAASTKMLRYTQLLDTPSRLLVGLRNAIINVKP